MWWLGQSEEARARLSTDTMVLPQALLDFNLWYGEPDSLSVWGNGAAADNVWLRSAYGATGIPAPWSFRNDRCYRTIKNLPICSEIEFVRIGVFHNALDDAESQALHLIKMLGVL
jgi:hypothetical protein